MSTHIDKTGMIVIDAYDDYSNFRVLTLSGFESIIGTNLQGEVEIVKLASKIRRLGTWRYTTKNVWPRPQRRLHGHDKLGELNIRLNFDMDSRVFNLSHTMHGFRTPTSSHLKISALFPILKQYIAKTSLPVDGTIFEDV